MTLEIFPARGREAFGVAADVGIDFPACVDQRSEWPAADTVR